jgi:hypothetical protein
MLTRMKFGTYIFFGLLTFGGAIFVWLVSNSPIPITCQPERCVLVTIYYG